MDGNRSAPGPPKNAQKYSGSFAFGGSASSSTVPRRLALDFDDRIVSASSAAEPIGGLLLCQATLYLSFISFS